MKYKYNGQWYDLSCSLNVSNLLIGEIIEYAGESIPGGYLVCDGSAVSRTEYSELFDVIGTIYGSGDGSTTFNLPDLRGRVVTGLNTTNSNFNVLGKTGGEETVTLTIENIPSHAHGTAVTDSSMGASAGNASMITGYQKTDGYPTGATGGNQPHNNLQPYITINYLIRAKKTKNVLTTASTVVDSLEGNSTVDAPSQRAVNEEFSNVKGKILWTNPNPTKPIDTMTINLNSDDYDILEVYTKESTSTIRMYHNKMIKGYSCKIMNVAPANAPYVNYRNLEYVNDTTYALGAFSGLYEGDKNNMIPLYIIGYKTGLFS